MYDRLSLAESNARDLKLATKEKTELVGKLSAADFKTAELLATIELAKKKKEKVERKHEQAIYPAQVQLCNAYVDIEVFKHGTTVIGQLADFVATTREGPRMLEFTKKDMFNYLATNKLITVDRAKSQGCSFDFFGMDLDITEGFNEAIAKVTEDLKSLDKLLVEADNLNNFPKQIAIPHILEAFRVAVDKCLAKDPPLEVPKLSNKGMRIFSGIDLNAKLKLPRDLSDDLNEGDPDEVAIPGLGE